MRFQATKTAPLAVITLTVALFASQALGGTPVHVDFETVPLTPGSSVEGLGTVHPDLRINAKYGTAVLIQQGALPKAYGAPNGSGSQVNGCLAHRGFSDMDSVAAGASVSGTHRYVFRFSPGTTVSDFSIRMLDYGDWNPARESRHIVKLIAYDSTNTVVDSHVLSYRTPATNLPRSSYSPNYGDLYITGDACTANPGEPGHWIFSVSGTDIVRVRSHF